MSDFELVARVDDPLPSPARRDPPQLSTIRVGAVQCAWNPDRDRHLEVLERGVGLAVGEGAEVVCLQELTLSPYFPARDDIDDALERFGEDIETGPTTSFARRMAQRHNVAVHASLYERADESTGYNTAVCVDRGGRLVARTRKIHIPRFPGYHEDRYFAPGDSGFPVVDIAGSRFGFPTCWDQWFPEVARIYSLEGADVIVYPTAIGSEPQLPDFDTQPLWEKTIAASGLANATFMVAVNRIGSEPPLEFYGSSFISDPYGRVLARAPRERPAVLVADLDLNHRRDWLNFELIATRRPDQYRRLLEATSRASETASAEGATAPHTSTQGA
jgi:N-carbamoylputrescine amidase